MLATKTQAAIESREVPSEGPRKHLGASVIGRACARQVWYMFRWVRPEKFDQRVLRLFHRGHREEIELIRLLEGIGVQVWHAGENGELKKELQRSSCNGHFGGTPDGVGVGVPDLDADTACLLEFKTHGEKSFDKVRDEGVMAAKWEHFVQMQIYMHLLALPVALYVAVNKNDDALHLELVRYDMAVAKKYLQRAMDIIQAKSPPARINESPGYFVCKFCWYASICHDGAPVDQNCRTCQHGAPAAEGQWTCAKQRKEIATQQGCPEYLTAPAFDDSVPF